MSRTQHPKLLDEVRNVIHLKRYALSTTQNYCSWIILFVKYHKLSTIVELMIDTEMKFNLFNLSGCRKRCRAHDSKPIIECFGFLHQLMFEQPLGRKIAGIRSNVIKLSDSEQKTACSFSTAYLLDVRL